MESDQIDFNFLESHRGFLIYLVQTYPAVDPYLKEIHLMLDSWQPWRKDNGWRMAWQKLEKLPNARRISLSAVVVARKHQSLQNVFQGSQMMSYCCNDSSPYLLH